MSDFTPITTQEEFDAAIKARLAREKEKHADYDQLKTLVDELKTENGALKSAMEANKSAQVDYEKQIQDLQGQVKGFESKDLRTRIALANGLPFDLAERLVGDDEAAITADAEHLASMMQAQAPTPPLKSTEPAFLPGSEDAAYKKALQELKGD